MKTALTHNSEVCKEILRILGFEDNKFVSSLKVVINSEDAYVIYTEQPNDLTKRTDFKLKHFLDPRTAAGAMVRLFNLPEPLCHIEFIIDQVTVPVLKIEKYIYVEDLDTHIAALQWRESK